MDLKGELSKKVLLFDGAMGTMLQKTGAKYSCPEELNLTNYNLVAEIHKKYADAGSDILTTNTFGANRIKLAEYNLEKKVYEINWRAVDIAKQTGKYAAASVGPTGKLMKPLGGLTFDEAYDAFHEQIKAQVMAGADIILIETMQDVHEAKAAAIAAREFKLPVIVSFTYEKNLRTLTGTTPEGVAVIFENLADAIGINCGVSLENTLEIVRQYSSATSIPILAQPNIPVNGCVSHEDYAKNAPHYLESGANIVGGCCGTTPETIAKISELLKGRGATLKQQMPLGPTRIASRSKVLKFDSNTKLVGERINTTGRKWLRKALDSNSYGMTIGEAQKQADAGADALDINLNGPNEAKHMSTLVTELSSRLDMPLFIDSTDPETIEAGLKAYPGKVVINSVNGDTIDKIIPLAKKYGAAVIALAMDANGIADKARERVTSIEKVTYKSKIPQSEILADCLALALGAEQEKTFETIKAIALANEKGYKTVLGISNVSFKMPNRELLNSSFLSMAVAAGVNAVIADPLNESIMGALRASLALTGQDKNCAGYLKKYAADTKQEAATLEDRIKLSVLKGDKENILGHVEDALKRYNPLEVINSLLIPAITDVGERFDKGTLYLPQLMLSAETMQLGLARAKQDIKKSEQESKGKIVLATVEGDLHDIGKTIVKLVMETNGYEVIDLGKNVKAEKIIDELKRSNAEYLGLSSLLTTTAERMREVVDMLKKENLNPKVLIGGAAVSEDYAEKIGAHAYCRTPFDALKVIK